MANLHDNFPRNGTSKRWQVIFTFMIEAVMWNDKNVNSYTCSRLTSFVPHQYFSSVRNYIPTSLLHVQFFYERAGDMRSRKFTVKGKKQ